MISGNVQLMFNTTEGAKAIADSRARRSALCGECPTTLLLQARKLLYRPFRRCVPVDLKLRRCSLF